MFNQERERGADNKAYIYDQTMVATFENARVCQSVATILGMGYEVVGLPSTSYAEGGGTKNVGVNEVRIRLFGDVGSDKVTDLSFVLRQLIRDAAEIGKLESSTRDPRMGVLYPVDIKPPGEGQTNVS